MPILTILEPGERFGTINSEGKLVIWKVERDGTLTDVTDVPGGAVWQ